METNTPRRLPRQATVREVGLRDGLQKCQQARYKNGGNRGCC